MYKYYFLCIFVLSVFLWFPSLSFSIEYELRFKHLTIDQGLSGNKVNTIYQDTQGFIWIGTNEGLNRYDGYEFKIYDKGVNDPKKLSDDFIQYILEDSQGRLWIGTGNGGLNLYDRATDTFTYLTTDSSSEIQLSSNALRAIIEGADGKIWIATEFSIEQIDLQRKTSESYIPDHFLNNRKDILTITCLFEDKDNNLWFGTAGAGLCLFDKEKHTFTYFRHDPANPGSISDDDVRCIYEDNDGVLWVGTYNGGLNRYNTQTKSFTHFYPDREVQESLTVKSLLCDDQGRLWVGTRNGLFLFDKTRQQFQHFKHDIFNPTGLNNNNIQVIFKDRRGDYWFGTKEGVNFLNTTNRPFIHYRAGAYNRRGLNHKTVAAIYEDRFGYIWFATVEGGLNRFDSKKRTYTYFTHKADDPYSIGSNNVNSVIGDDKGNLWIGTFQGGLNFFDRKSKRFYRYKINPNKPLILQQAINTVMVDGDYVWVGTESGLYRFNITLKKFTRFKLTERDDSFSIRCIVKDSVGEILVSGNDSRLFVINPSDLSLNTYKLPTSTKYSIITEVKEDIHSNLWIGTRGGGLIFFNRKNSSFTIYTKKDGLPSNILLGILIDENENLWIGTTYGLSKFNPKTKKFTNFYKENGLPSNEFTSARFKSLSGEMFFGGINGATSFRPKEIKENNFVPHVVLTDFQIFNHSVPIGGKNPILTRHISVAKKINLTYRHSVLTFTFSALNFASNDQIQYAYIMEGFEQDWNYVGTRRFATYTNLNPGVYTFRVKATGNGGLWPQEDTSILITIAPPFWETWWFRMVIAFAVLLTLWHFAMYLKQKRDLLKTKALVNITQLKLFRNQMNPHFLLNTFSAIRALVLIDKNQAWNMISELSEYFRYVLHNYNRVEASLNDEIDAARNYINIQRLLDDTLEVTFTVDESSRECIVPAFILQPLIENAIKHGSRTLSLPLTIHVHISYTNGILSIDVSNSGNLDRGEVGKNRDDNVHGTSIININKRLHIMFDNHYTFELYGENGWVHAKICIEYEKNNLFKLLENDSVKTAQPLIR
ncbi:MAG TPA: hypothetical protein ENK44_06475 [Caldithrix abyssi]|uniref:Histidine kinase n=1 Tax=Caldithrix abyssi TaxID=187145 RepID=A0A7V4WUH0_CALAY|nr:hypothetical protein [Caldithrix abyssi]